MTYDVIEAARRTTRRRNAAVAWAALVLLAAAATVWLFAAGHGSDAAAPSPTGATTSTSDSRASSTSAGARPALPDDVGWADVAGVALPTSASVGPHEVRDGRARGFAHTEAGAVFAAAHLLVRTAAQVGPRVFDPTIAEQVVGPDQPSMREQVAQTYTQLRDTAQVPDGQPVGRLSGALRGFRVDSYTPTEAVLVVLTEATDSTATTRLAATQVRMRWTGGDWAMVAPAGGTWDDAVLIVTAEQATAFTAFGRGR
jgi:hypothetical protein